MAVRLPSAVTVVVTSHNVTPRRMFKAGNTLAQINATPMMVANVTTVRSN